MFFIEFEIDIFLEKPKGKKLFKFKFVYSLCNPEKKMLTFIFPLFQGKIIVIYNRVVTKLAQNI